MIGIYATSLDDSFETINILRERKIPFKLLDDFNNIPVDVTIVIMFPQGCIVGKEFKITVGLKAGILVDLALAVINGKKAEKIILGIDPGPYPAMATIINNVVMDVEQFYNMNKMVDKVKSYRYISNKIILKIGNGDPVYGQRIIKKLHTVVDETIIVNEKNTSKIANKFDIPYSSNDEKRVRRNKGAAIAIGLAD
ncbi:MAG: hypothetical protein ACP5RS_01140 [Thermoplasmata archaeon]